MLCASDRWCGSKMRVPVFVVVVKQAIEISTQCLSIYVLQVTPIGCDQVDAPRARE